MVDGLPLYQTAVLPSNRFWEALLTGVEALTPITKEVLDKVNKIALSESVEAPLAASPEADTASTEAA